MSSLGFPSYSSSSVTSASSVTVASRKFHEGNSVSGSSGMTYLQPNEVSSAAVEKMSSTAYPYFTTPGTDLYASTSPYGSANSSTGVFSSRTLQPTRPRSKSRANAGKIS